MLDIREEYEDQEEAIRVGINEHFQGKFSSLRVKVSEDSKDGHTARLQPVIQGLFKDKDGNVTAVDLPLLINCPISFKQGGDVAVTHPIKKGDEGIATFATAPIDTWQQQGDDTQVPIDSRTHSLSDATYHPGGRSDPNKLKQVAQDSHQTRSVDKKSVVDHHPTDGTTIKHVDPSEPGASDNHDPYTQSKKYYERKVHPSDGHSASAVDSGTTHSTTLTHSDGFKASANNDQHSTSVHPSNGVTHKSSSQVTTDAPNHNVTQNQSVGQNLTAGQNISAGQNINAGSSMSAPSGNFLGGAMGGLSMVGGVLSSLAGLLTIDSGQSSGSSSVQAQSVSGNSVTGQRVISTGTLEPAAYTVAALIAMTTPAIGTRATVTDYSDPSPTYYEKVLSTQGGGTTVVGVLFVGVKTGFVTGWVVG